MPNILNRLGLILFGSLPEVFDVVDVEEGLLVMV